MKGTIKEPPPIPNGTDIKPTIKPAIFFVVEDKFLGLFIRFYRKIIKNKPTKKTNNEKNKTRAGVFKFTAKKVPNKTPIRIKIPKDLIILKSTASYSI